jgi:alkylation response protein AidB-like acyl-CoA dehydrogenase
VDLNLSEDQSALRDTLRDFFAKESPPDVVRDAEPLGFDAALWGKVADLGLCSIAVPEAQGGGSAGLQELAIAAEELGRCLAPVPLIEAAVANNLLASLSDAATDDASAVAASAVVASAVAGERLATLALRPAVGSVARLVPAGAVADVVVAVRGDELVLVQQRDRRPARPADAVANLGSAPVADCVVDGADVLVLANGPRARSAYERAVREWQVLTAAALVGLGTKALEMGVDYTMQRHAFGVLIATFQTIQHRLADNATALDGARLLAFKAAWAADEELPTAGTLATMAFLFAAETAFKTASESLHFHGGYGYTLEYDIQLYFRRAKAWPLLLGDPRAEYSRLAHRLFDSQET